MGNSGRWFAAASILPLIAAALLLSRGSGAEGSDPAGEVGRAPASAPEPAAAPASPTPSIRGIVVDGKGVGVAGAEVAAAREEGGVPVRAAAGPDGGFVLAGVEPGVSYLVGARAAGLAPGLEGGVRAGAEGVRIVLRTGFRLAGTVRGAGGAPRPGARVRVLLRFPGIAKPLGGMEVRADEEGRYLFAGLPRVGGEAAASWKGGSSGPRGYEPPEAGDENLLDLEVEAGPSLSGRVRSEDGRPLGGMSVSAGTEEAGFRTAVTRDDGTFEIAGLAAIPLSLRVHDEEGRYLREATEGCVPPREGIEVVLRTNPAAPGRFVFRCVDGAGKPVGRVRLEVVAGDAERPCGLGSATPDREGVFRPARTRAGNYRITVSCGAGVFAGEEFAVEPGKTTDLGTLRLAPGASVRGRVVLDGAASPEGILLMTGNSPMPENGAVDAEGGFLLAGLPPGRGSIRVAHPSAELVEVPWTAGPGESADLGEVRMRAAGGAVRGSVRSAGTPLSAGAFVRLSREDVSGTASLDREARPGPDGRFEFTGVPAGTWRIDAGVATELAGGRFTSGQRGRDVTLAEGEQAEIDLAGPAR